MKTAMSEKYIRRLYSLPMPGVGNEFHMPIQAGANYGILAGMEESEIWGAVRRASQNLKTYHLPQHMSKYKTIIIRDASDKAPLAFAGGR